MRFVRFLRGVSTVIGVVVLLLGTGYGLLSGLSHAGLLSPAYGGVTYPSEDTAVLVDAPAEADRYAAPALRREHYLMRAARAYEAAAAAIPGPEPVRAARATLAGLR